MQELPLPGPQIHPLPAPKMKPTKYIADPDKGIDYLWIPDKYKKSIRTGWYLDDLLNIDNPYFEGMVNRIYPPELQLNKGNIFDTEAPFLDLHLFISNGFVSSKIYDKRDDFDFDTVNFQFFGWWRSPFYLSRGLHFQLIRFARVSSHVADFNARNKSLTAKLLRQGYRYHKLRKTFSKFYRRHCELVSKFNVGLKPLLQQGLSESEFYGDLVYKFKNIEGRADFFDKCLTQSRLITLLPSLISRLWVGRQTQWWPRHKAIYFSRLGPERFCPLLGPPGFNCWFSFAPVFQWCCSTPQGSLGVGCNTFLSSPHLCFIIVFICDLFVSRDDP